MVLHRFCRSWLILPDDTGTATLALQLGVTQVCEKWLEQKHAKTLLLGLWQHWPLNAGRLRRRCVLPHSRRSQSLLRHDALTTYDRVPSGPGTSSLAFSPQPGCLGPRWSVSVQGSCLRNNTALAFCEVLQDSWQGCNPQMRTLPCGPPQVLPQLADLA